jgi:hypothetical protein
MADFGINRRYTRDKVPLQVLVGFYPTEPVKLSSLAAPLDVEDGNVAIKSGMAIVKDDGHVYGVSGSGFRSAQAVDQSPNVSVFIALQDASSLDVQASGKLVGLDCSDKFEVQTGYYDATITWAVDMALTVGDDGVFTEAGTGDVIVGYITAIGSGTRNTIVVPGKTPSAADTHVIQFKTAQTGFKKLA